MLDGACRVRSCLKGSSVCWLTGGEGRVSNDTVSQSSPDIYGLQKYLSDEQNRCYIIQVSQLRRLFSIFYHFLFFLHILLLHLSHNHFCNTSTSFSLSVCLPIAFTFSIVVTVSEKVMWDTCYSLKPVRVEGRGSQERQRKENVSEKDDCTNHDGIVWEKEKKMDDKSR